MVIVLAPCCGVFETCVIVIEVIIRCGTWEGRARWWCRVDGSFSWEVVFLHAKMTPPPVADPPPVDCENDDFLVPPIKISFRKCYFWCFLGVSKNAIFWSFFWGGSEGGVVLPTMSCPVCLRQVVLQTGILLLCCAQHEVCRETQRCVRHTETD